MAEIKHTPGPWEVAENDCEIGDSFYQKYQINGNGYVLAVVMTDCQSLQNDANARLIAAAPELLDLLIKARRYVGMVTEVADDEPIFGVMDDIDAAIAKATGAQS